jgi:hypothetical protein
MPAAESKNLHDASAAASDGVEVYCRGWAGVTIQAEGAGYTGTFYFEGRLKESSTWCALSALDMDDMATPTYATSEAKVAYTGAELWRARLEGVDYFRLRITRSAGTFTANARFTPTELVV